MRKSVIFLLAVVLGLALVFLTGKRNRPFEQFPPGEKLSRMIIRTDGVERDFVLKADGKWWLNDTVPVDWSLAEQMRSAMEGLQVKSPVSSETASKLNGEESGLAEVKLYTGEAKASKRPYVFRVFTQSYPQSGVYAVTYRKGYPVILSSKDERFLPEIFRMGLNDWAERFVFARAEDIRRMQVMFPDSASYTLIRENSDLLLLEDGKETGNGIMNDSIRRDLQQRVAALPFSHREPAATGNAGPDLAEIVLTDGTGKTYRVRISRIRLTRPFTDEVTGKIVQFNRDDAFGFINGAGSPVVIKYFYLDRLLKPLSFYKQQAHQHEIK